MSNFGSYTDIDLTRELSPITEAYYGRSKHLLAAQKAIKELLDMLYSEYKGGGEDFSGYAEGFNKIANSSKGRKLISAVEQAFKKQFGFKEFNLIISREWSLMGPNAFTIQGVVYWAGSSGMKNFLPLKQKSGGYYDTNHDYICTVFTTSLLFGVYKLTPEEIMGLLLHEIGHNFQCTPLCNIAKTIPFLDIYQQIKSINRNPTFMKILNLIYSAPSEFFGNELWAKIFRECEQYWDSMTAGTRKAWDEFFQYNWITNTQIMTAIPFLFPVLFGKQMLDMIRYPNPLEIFASVCGYSGEVFADSFAVAYGYGAGLSSALSKIERSVFIQYNELLSKDSPVKPIYELSAVTLEIMMAMFNMDAHPSTQKRIINTIDKLERELKSGELPPNLKKQALNDLAKSRKMYKDYLEADGYDSKLAILGAYRQINDFLGGNLDWRGILNKIVNLGQYEA